MTATKSMDTREKIDPTVPFGEFYHNLFYLFIAYKTLQKVKAVRLPVHDEVLITTLGYRSETRKWQRKGYRRLIAVEMRSPRVMCGKMIHDCITNEKIALRCL